MIVFRSMHTWQIFVSCFVSFSKDRDKEKWCQIPGGVASGGGVQEAYAVGLVSSA